jgi:hypothetical protein
MDTSEPSPGTSKERSDGNPDNEPDFTIATISRKGLDFQGCVRKRSDSRKEEIPFEYRQPRVMSPEGVFHPDGIDSLERKQFPDRLETPEVRNFLDGFLPSRVFPTGDVIGTDASQFF